MTEATKGELAVLKMRHSYTFLNGETSTSYTFEPVYVERTDLQGRVSKARKAHGGPAEVGRAAAIYAIPNSSAVRLLPMLEESYDDIESARAAIRTAMSAERVYDILNPAANATN